MNRSDAAINEKHLLELDAKRNIGAELLLSVRQLTAGQGKAVFLANSIPWPTEQHGAPPCRNLKKGHM
jgi:hypothetical protein